MYTMAGMGFPMQDHRGASLTTRRKTEASVNRHMINPSDMPTGPRISPSSVFKNNESLSGERFGEAFS